MDGGRLAVLAVNDEGFIFDPTTGESFTCNSTGLAVLRALKDGRSPAEVAALLADGYEVTPDQAAHDVEDFLGQLRTWRLI